LPSNQEILFDIRSIHSYDSLSSLNYQKLALSMNTLGTVTYGRHFDYIDSADRIESPEFKYMGVSLLISRDGIDSSACKLLDEINGIKLYRIVSTPVLYAQVQDFILKSDRRVILTGFPDEHTMLNITKPAGYDDCISFLTTAAKQETLLFVSQQYHPFWIASSGNQKLRTVRINDFYLGAIIPAGTASVEFRFRPYAWWCWVPQLFYMITGCVAIIGIIRGSAPLTDLH
jgi:hypothetical protein